MEAFGDAVVSGEPPQGSDLLFPGIESVAELDQGREADSLEFSDGSSCMRQDSFSYALEFSVEWHVSKGYTF